MTQPDLLDLTDEEEYLLAESWYAQRARELSAPRPAPEQCPPATPQAPAGIAPPLIFDLDNEHRRKILDAKRL